MGRTANRPFLLALHAMSLLPAAHAVDIAIANPGFEDIFGQSPFNEFTFGTPAGWTRYDPNNITMLGGVFVGTLLPNGAVFFDDFAPEGVRVGILFANDQLGAGEYGFEQTLAEVLSANTQYELMVEVGNIASGTDEAGTFFNLDEFPGYRVNSGRVVSSLPRTTTVWRGSSPRPNSGPPW